MMRKTAITLPFLMALMSLFGTTAAAQDMAHINQQAILESMPERQQAQKELQKFQQQLQSKIQEMRKEYQSKMTELQEKEGELTETEKEMMQDELTSLQQRIQKAQRSAQEDIQKQREELLTPIKDKIDRAVEKVAKDEGYTYVLYERSLPYSGGEDLTAEVKKELEKQSSSGGGTSEQ